MRYAVFFSSRIDYFPSRFPAGNNLYHICGWEVPGGRERAAVAHDGCSCPQPLPPAPFSHQLPVGPPGPRVSLGSISPLRTRAALLLGGARSSPPCPTLLVTPVTFPWRTGSSRAPGSPAPAPAAWVGCGLLLTLDDSRGDGKCVLPWFCDLGL